MTQERLLWDSWVFVCSEVRKDWTKRLKVYFQKKEKKIKPRRGGVVTNNVALPEMLLTSSPVQRFHLFFSSRCLIYLPIPHISIHLNSPSFLCHLSSCCCSLLLGNASPHPVPSLIPHLSFVLLSPYFLSSLHFSFWKEENLKKKKRKKDPLEARDAGAVYPTAELHKSDTPLHPRVKNQRKNSTFFFLEVGGGENSFQHRRGYRGQLLLAINFTHT